MQTNLNNTKADMVKIQKEIDDTSKKLKSSKVDWESVGETVGKAGKAIGAACAAMGAAIAAAGAAFFGLAEETREARENMGKLETSFTTAGHSAEDAKNTYTELYGVLGDDGQATEAAAHLAKLTTNEKELSDWTNICTGVYATFGDSLPIEGLTEAANETAKTGSITGNLADALNWAGVSEDDFQASLDACTSEQERQALITSTLNGLYSEAADKYREVNGDIIDAQKATANLNSAMAALGAIAEPIITKLKQLAAELLQEITPFVELIGKGLTGALSGAESAAEDFTDGLLGMVTFAIEKLTEMLPTFLEFAVKMIYRELKRGRYTHLNSDLTTEERYSPEIAQQRYEENLKAKGGELKIGNDYELSAFIEKKIGEEGYSPAAVVGEIKRLGLTFKTEISEKTIYNYIDKGIFYGISRESLPEHGERKRKYDKVERKKAARAPQGESIEERPQEINDRQTFGHWEGDCVCGKKRTKETLFVLSERLTRNEIIIKMPDQTAASVVAALNKLERRFGKKFSQIFKSITFDNGSEFMDCAGIEKSVYGKDRKRTKVYYCHPYSAYERGTNENINKMIRRFLPKGTDFRKVTAAYIQRVETWINNYPREILGFETSGSLFERYVAEAA